MMRRQTRTLFSFAHPTSLALLLAAGCGGSNAAPDGGSGAPPVPTISVSGLIVRAPGVPTPLPEVTVAVIDPPEMPPRRVQTDTAGRFKITNVPNPSGKIRLFINGMTGLGGPFITTNTEYAAGATDLDIGTVRLVPMATSEIITLSDDLASITQLPDGRIQATLRQKITVSGGATGQPNFAASLTLPQGAVLVFPLTSFQALNITALPPDVVPAPMPTAMDGSPRFTQYVATLQPEGLELAAPVSLSLPEIDGAAVNDPLEFWQTDTTSRAFAFKQAGSVVLIPVQNPPLPYAVPAAPPMVSRFEIWASMPMCRAHATRIVGRTVDSESMPLTGATVRARGLETISDMAGNFQIPAAPLGCDAMAPAPIDIAAQLVRQDGVLLSGSATAAMPMPDADTNVGDIKLDTPLYVVRSQPDRGPNGETVTGVPLNSNFDVYFSEPIDPASVTAITVELANSDGPSYCAFSPITGAAYADTNDHTHVRFLPDTDLAEGQLYRGHVAASTIVAVSGHHLPRDFERRFFTVSPSDTQGPSVQITFPTANSVTAGEQLTALGYVNDNIGVRSAFYRLCPAPVGTASAVCPTEGANCQDLPAGLLSTDPCVPLRSAQATAAITIPPTPGAAYCLSLHAQDLVGNASPQPYALYFTANAPGPFPFCGTNPPTVFVGSNGYLTFFQGDSSYVPTVDQFFAFARIAAFYTDDDARVQGAQVFTNPVSGPDAGFAVTWLGNGMFSLQPGPNSYQIVLFRSGAIQISWGGITDQIPSTTRDIFMGLSCPGTSATATPPAGLLSNPHQAGEGHDIAWSGDPVYDFVDVPSTETTTTRISGGYANRYFNFVPPGVQAPAFVPMFSQGTAVPNVLSDDTFTEIQIQIP